jgi:hypothetical protein
MKKFKIALSIFIFILVFLPLASYGMAQQKGVPNLENIPAIPKAISENNVIQDQVQAKTMNANQGEVKAVQLKQNIGEGLGAENATGVRQQVKAGAVGNNSRAIQRRSKVANAVQKMLKVAERNGKVGQKIEIIARTQAQNQSKIENQMEQIQNRGKLKKFFFGPDYKKISSVEEKIANHDEKIAELKALALELIDLDDLTILENQITVMEQVKSELVAETLVERKGFSLFGWLNKMFSK